MSDKAKKILFKDQARKKLFKGVHFIADVTRTSLGKNSAHFDDGFVKDLISSYIKDEFEKIGAEFALNTAYNTNKSSNDGATSSIVMLDAILKEGIKLIDNNICPHEINKELDFVLTDLNSKLNKITYSIQDTKDLTKILDYYARQNEQVASFILNAFEKVSLSGIILVEESKKQANKIEVVDGLELNQGYLSNYFCTDEENTLVEFNQCNVLVLDKKILSIQEIFPFIKRQTDSKKELLIIAEKIHQDVVSTLAINKLQKTIKIAAIEFSNSQFKTIEDIACLTSTSIVSQKDTILDKSDKILGYADKITIFKDKTVIAKNKSNLSFDHLKNKVAIIYIKPSIGGSQKKLYESCIIKAKNAIKNKVVAGGGISLFFAMQELDEKNYPENGLKLLKAAIYAPLMQIIVNAGHVPGPIIDKISKMGYPNGLSLNCNKVENLFQCGILDPLDVIKNSLANAVSTAKMMFLTDAIMTNNKD